VLLTTKSYDTEYAAKEIAKRFPDTPVISFQNGLNNIDVLSKYVDARKVYAGTTSHGVTLLGPGQIKHAGTGMTCVGAPDVESDPDVIEALADALTAAGMKTDVSSNIVTDIWRKGVVNAGINPVTAIANVPNGQILTSPELKECAIALSTEAEQVAVALGYNIEDGVEEMLKVANRTAHNRSSMLQDVERKKPTEIQAITGVIVAEGERLDIDVRYSEVFLLMVKGIERTFASQA
jgi:2-dehydropantoate 2-reductase